MQLRTASSIEPERRSSSAIRFAITSVSVVVQKIWPACSYAARSSRVFTRLPLWASANERPRNWKLNGWKFSGRFAPVVGYRTCPTPTVPWSPLRISVSKTSATSPEPLCFRRRSPSKTEIPALSCPRC